MTEFKETALPGVAANENSHQMQALVEQPPVTRGQKILLPAALLIGFLCQQVFFRLETPADFSLWYSLIWLSYIGVFAALCYKKVRENLFAMPFALIAGFLAIMMNFQARGYSDRNLLMLNAIIVPGILMLYTQMVVTPLEKQQEARYAYLFLRGFFVQPFLYLGRFFRTVGSIFNAKGESRMVWVGIAVAVPVVLVVLWLLLSADAVMEQFAWDFLGNFQLASYLWRGILLLLFAMLFYGFLYGCSWAKPAAAKRMALSLWSATAPRVVVSALLLVYVLFTGVQFLYLFGGHGLPEGLTYAEYAREGFGQLIWVAAINLAVFSVCLCRTKDDKILRGLLLALMAATAVILISAFTRLFLYIGAYDLTLKRVQAFWMLAYISVVIVLCAIRLYQKKLPLLRCTMLLMAGWYAVLNIVDLNALYALRF